MRLWRATESPVWDAALREHAAALDEFCEAVKDIADQLGKGVQPSPEQLSREHSASLRLENSRALLTFGVGIRPSRRPFPGNLKRSFH